MKPLQRHRQPEDRLKYLTSATFRLYWESFILLSISIDGYLLTIPPDPLLFGLWLRLMVSSYLIGYLFGIAPILVKAIQRRLDADGASTSTMVAVLLFTGCCAAVLLEPILRILSATQLPGKGYRTMLFLLAFTLLQLVRSRKEIKQLLTSSRSKDIRAPMVALSLRLTYVIAIPLLRASLAFAALAVSSGRYHPGAYAAILFVIVSTCALMRNHQEA